MGVADRWEVVDLPGYTGRGHQATPADPWEGRQLWDRARGESGVAFEAFVAYRDQGLRRTKVEAAKIIGKNNLARIEGWSQKWSWKARVEAWDIHVDRENQLSQIEAAKKMHERHANLAAAISGKVLARLQALDDADLRAMTLKDIANTLETAARIERVARGEAADRTETEQKVTHTGHVGLELTAVVGQAMNRRQELYGELDAG